MKFPGEARDVSWREELVVKSPLFFVRVASRLSVIQKSPKRGNRRACTMYLVHVSEYVFVPQASNYTSLLSSLSKHSPSICLSKNCAFCALEALFFKIIWKGI